MQDLESFKGVKVCRVVRDYRGDYIDVPSYSYLVNILQIQKQTCSYTMAATMPAATTAKDTITTGYPIRDIYGETLISAGNKFQLGFFSTMGESGYVAST
ncbi:unnamed protein product [Camellia sinensis]